MPVIVYVSRCAVMQQQLLLSLMAYASSRHRMRLESAIDLSESVKTANKGSGLYTIRYTILTCIQKLTNGQLNLPHGTKKVMKKLKTNKNSSGDERANVNFFTTTSYM